MSYMLDRVAYSSHEKCNSCSLTGKSRQPFFQCAKRARERERERVGGLGVVAVLEGFGGGGWSWSAWPRDPKTLVTCLVPPR